MKILMLSPIPIFPNNVGDRVRIKGIALGLAKHHQVNLIAPIYSSDNNHLNEINRPNLTYIPVKVEPSNYFKKINCLFSNWPYHTALRYSHEISKTIKQTLASATYDLIYCHFLQTLPYVKRVNIPIVLDQHNVDYIYWERQVQQYQNPILKWLAKRNLKKTVQFEQSFLPNIHTIVSVSAKDKELTEKYAKKELRHFLVAPNGVDLEQFRYREKEASNKKMVLGFFGSMDLAYNEDGAIELIQHILPKVQEKLPFISCSTLIIGRNPSKNLKKVALKSKYSIQVTGTVENLLSYLHQVDILVLPLTSGAGTKLRISEAMAAGIPIVGSQFAIAGFEDYVAEEYLYLAKNRTAFIHKIADLALNPHKMKEVRQRARDLVEQKYNWEKIAGLLAQDLLTLKSITQPSPC